MALYAHRHVVSNERTCYWFLHRLRWPTGVQCPRYDNKSMWRMMERGRPEYRCKACRYHFSLLTGSELESTRLPLTKWLLAAALFSIGISSHSLAREIQVSPRIAWSMLHKFRKALENHQLLHKLRGSVEVDETYFGGRVKGKRGRGAAHKTIVLGLKTRRDKFDPSSLRVSKRVTCKPFSNNRLLKDRVSTPMSTLSTPGSLLGLPTSMCSTQQTVHPRTYAHSRH